MAADGTTYELLNRNFNRIDSALAARIAAAPLPSSPVLGDYGTPTIGLAYTSDANWNATWEAIDGLFATPVVKKPIRFTAHENWNRNIQKVIVAFLALGVVPVLADFVLPTSLIPPEEPAPPPEPETEPEPAPEPEPEPIP